MMLDIQARQKWLRENAEMLAALWEKFENDPLAVNDKRYDGWVICAYVDSAQFLTRAKLYDEPLVKSAMSDDELKRAAAACMRRKQREASRTPDDGDSIPDDKIMAGHFSLCYGYELEFILNATKKKEAAENV